MALATAVLSVYLRSAHASFGTLEVRTRPKNSHADFAITQAESASVVQDTSLRKIGIRTPYSQSEHFELSVQGHSSALMDYSSRQLLIILPADEGAEAALLRQFLRTGASAPRVGGPTQVTSGQRTDSPAASVLRAPAKQVAVHQSHRLRHLPARITVLLEG